MLWETLAFLQISPQLLTYHNRNAKKQERRRLQLCLFKHSIITSLLGMTV